jgi:hypothetical protein
MEARRLAKKLGMVTRRTINRQCPNQFQPGPYEAYRD